MASCPLGLFFFLYLPLTAIFTVFLRVTRWGGCRACWVSWTRSPPCARPLTAPCSNDSCNSSTAGATLKHHSTPGPASLWSTLPAGWVLCDVSHVTYRRNIWTLRTPSSCFIVVASTKRTIKLSLFIRYYTYHTSHTLWRVRVWLVRMCCFACLICACKLSLCYFIIAQKWVIFQCLKMQIL